MLDKKINNIEEKKEKLTKKKNEETNEEIKITVKNVETVVKCREFGGNFEKKTLKHITEFHPKTINFDKCHETFDQHWKL